MIEQTKTVKESLTEMNELVLPNDTNVLGNLMGGNLMRWMDIASAICAAKHCEAHVVTVSVDHLTFQEPIKLGDVVNIKASVTRAFNTSVEVFLEVFTRGVLQNHAHKSNQAFFTFVALDERTMKPKSIPTVIPETELEQKLYEEAGVRREFRLVVSGRIKPSEATQSKDFLNQ
ncbi:MAG: acyl-CoA thioesterase [Saprospiraceae bacterium]|nr:acyl-CoA thioesterase [Saprospiraceae bacterium]MBK7359568.1 acyl-CoA thioesterase [Saprospiraceae bacterium]MBK7736962.1 acyl-CoA thioesterase [Saprospiraceae bacterium]MBK7914444.1 acyl-CoA thioesterase [Saprospiraceae bacterium]